MICRHICKCCCTSRRCNFCSGRMPGTDNKHWSTCWLVDFKLALTQRRNIHDGRGRGGLLMPFHEDKNLWTQLLHTRKCHCHQFWHNGSDLSVDAFSSPVGLEAGSHWVPYRCRNSYQHCCLLTNIVIVPDSFPFLLVDQCFAYDVAVEGLHRHLPLPFIPASRG